MLICIEGCIGVGKTTLTQILCKQLGAEGVFEDFENNPFLIPFYQQPEIFSFHVQLCFLLLQHAKLLNNVTLSSTSKKIFIADFSIVKTEIFSDLVLKPEQYTLLAPIYSYLNESLQQPTLTIYLYGSVPLIMSRIRHRAHPTDANIQPEYISRVSSSYGAFFTSYSSTPLISINIDSFDCFSAEHIDNLVSRIRQRIGKS